MPGLCGTNLVKNIDKMTNSLLVNPYLESKDSYKSKDIEIGLVALKENQFNIYETKDLVIFVDGFVYNIEENNTKFKLQYETFQQQLSDAYFGGFLSELLKNTDGYFVVTIYDKAAKKILLISDRLGTRFVYWYHKNGIFSFSGEIRALLTLKEINKTIDKTSVGCFLAIGYLLGENTFFKSIKLIRPATIMEYDLVNDKLIQHYYWTFRDVKKQDISYEDAVDKLHELVEKSVMKRVENIEPDEMILPLSGGLDSRLIFAILNNHNKVPAFIYTNGDKDCTDVKYAKHLCKKYHFKHHRNAPQTQNDYIESGKDGSLVCEGMVPFIEYNTYKLFPKHYLISGFVGDVIFGATFKEEKDLLDHRMNSEIAERFYEKYKELADYNDKYFDISKLEASLLINRIRRHTTQMINGDAQVNEQILPYIDKDILDFIYSIPDEYRYNNYLYSDMLLKYYPEYFKKIPWNRYNRPIQGKIYKNNKYNLNWVIEKIEKCRWLGKKLKHSILKRINYHTWFNKKTFHVFQTELSKNENIQLIKDKYYNNSSLVKKYVSEQGWKKIGNYIENKYAWKISIFLTVEFYLRYLENKKII